MARPKGTGGKARLLTHAEIVRIDKCAIGTRHEFRNRAMFWLGLGTGMRIAEVVGLLLDDILDGHGRVVTQLSLEKHSTKSKRSRAIDVSEQAREKVQAYVDSRLKPDLDKPLAPELPLFPSQKSPRKPMSSKHAGDVIKKMAADAGVMHQVSSHSMRRTFTTGLCEAGAPMKYAQEQLGHASGETTSRYYEINPKRKQAFIAGLKM